VVRSMARTQKETAMPRSTQWAFEREGETLTAEQVAQKAGCKPASVMAMTRDGPAVIGGVQVQRVPISAIGEPPATQVRRKKAARIQAVNPTNQDDQRTPVEDNIKEVLDQLQRERDEAIDAIHERFNAQKDALERLRAVRQ
jgi:NACalpha-BTF3-like transcription factor